MLEYISVDKGCIVVSYFFFFSSRRRHTRYWRDWSSDVCSSDLDGVSDAHIAGGRAEGEAGRRAGAGSGRHGNGDEVRSEERRVGEEGRYLWGPYHYKKKKDIHILYEKLCIQNTTHPHECFYVIN